MPGFEAGGLAPVSGKFTAADRLAQAEGTVRDFCRWHIAPSKADQVDVTGSGYVTHVLPTRHLTAVADVTLDGTPLVEDVHFSVDPIGILRRIDGGRWRGRLRLTMTHGYPTPPPAVQAIIGDLAKVADLVGMSTVVAGPFTATVDRGAGSSGVVGLSGPQRAALSRYALEPGLC